MKILNIGSINIDQVYRVDTFVRPGETKTSKEMQINCGGKGLNQSIAASRAGNQVVHACLVGRDGAFLVKKMKENGVDVSLIRELPERSGHAIIQVDQEGQNCILLCAGTNRKLTNAYIDEVFTAFGTEGAVLLQNEVNELPYIIEKAHRAGMKIFLNAAPMDENIFECRLDYLDWLIVNEVEGMQIAGTDSIEQIIPTLHKKYPSMQILLTLGANGADCFFEGEWYHVDSCKVNVIDTTAAGDTFCGYFIYGILHEQPIGRVLQTASIASACCIGRQGAADSVPCRSEIEEIVNSTGVQIPKVVKRNGNE